MGNVNNIINYPIPPREAVRALGEMHLQNLWHERFLGGRTVQSDTGHSVKIISPGRWNRGAGPDFLNSRIIYDGREITGDVEIHKTPEEWYQHRHHTDPAYDNVRLHFSLSAVKPERIRNSAGRLVPQIFLDTMFSDEMLKIISDYRSDGNCFSPYWQNLECRNDFKKTDPQKLEDYFLAKGKERIAGKMERLGRRIGEAGYEQVIYEGLFESAGYTVNKHQFLLLAASMNMKILREILQWTDPGERRLTVEALLLGAARLLPGQSVAGDLDLEGSIWARELLVKWRKLRLTAGALALEPDFIRTSGQRPAASPVRSLAAIAGFLSVNFDRNIFELFFKPFQDIADDFSLLTDGIWKILNCSSTGFWSHRSNFCDRNEKDWASFGKDRVNRFIGNILLPVFLHYAGTRRDRQFEKKLMQIIAVLPAAHNRYTHFIFAQLPGRISRRLKLSFIIEQGIIAHYMENCSSDACFDCPLKYKI
jgi:hypothetical protein